MLPLGRQRDQRHVASRSGRRIGDLAGEAGAHMLGDRRGVLGEAASLRHAFEDGRQVADRDALGQQVLEHALKAAHRDVRGHQIRHQLLVLLAEIVEQLLRLGVGQKVRHVVLDDLGQVGGDDGGRVDHRVAAETGLLAVAVGHPLGGQAECRLGRVVARQGDGVAARIHDQKPVGIEFAAPGLDLLDADDVGVGAELHVVLDADGRQDEAHLVGELAAQPLDLVGKHRPVAGIDQRQQRVAELEPHVVEMERGRDRLFRGCGGACLGGALGLCDLRLAAAQVPRRRAGNGRHREERQHRYAGQ